jgi:hypothetical protein
VLEANSRHTREHKYASCFSSYSYSSAPRVFVVQVQVLYKIGGYDILLYIFCLLCSIITLYADAEKRYSSNVYFATVKSFMPSAINSDLDTNTLRRL